MTAPVGVVPSALAATLALAQGNGGRAQRTPGSASARRRTASLRKTPKPGHGHNTAIYLAADCQGRRRRPRKPPGGLGRGLGCQDRQTSSWGAPV